MEKKPTINDVAARAGVAKSTVSRVFAEGESVSQKTREKVMQAAKELGYSPDPLARALSIHSTGNIALVVPNIESIIMSQIIRGCISYLTKKNYAALVMDSSENFPITSEIKGPLSMRLIDALISCYGSAKDETMEISQRKPVVSIECKPVGYKADYVGINFEEGAKILLNYLKELGHKNISLVLGKKDEFAEERKNVIVETAKSVNISLKEEDIYFSNWTTYDGYQSMKKILKKDVIPTATIFISDFMAFGGIRAAIEEGISIPEDMSICGMDDSMTSKYTNPSLTTIKYTPFKLGMIAADMIVRRLEDPKAEYISKEIPVKLMIRESSGSAKK